MTSDVMPFDRESRTVSETPHTDQTQTWEHVQVLRLDPGDIVVLRLPYEPKFAEYEQLSAHLRALFPSHKSVILTGGIELRIMREEATQ